MIQLLVVAGMAFCLGAGFLVGLAVNTSEAGWKQLVDDLRRERDDERKAHHVTTVKLHHALAGEYDT